MRSLIVLAALLALWIIWAWHTERTDPGPRCATAAGVCF